MSGVGGAVMNIKQIAFGLGLAFVSVPQTCIAQFEISTAQVSKIISVAGRQRMLSQRISKSACLTAARINFSTNFNDTMTAHSEFEAGLLALRRGSAALGVLPVTFGDAVAELRLVSTQWQELDPFIGKIVDSGTISAADLNALDLRSLELLGLMSNTVATIVESYSGNVENISLGHTITVDIAGRQRMLSQKIVKEMCMMLVLRQPSTDLAQTVGLFDVSLKALIDGYAPAGVMPPPTMEIRAKLLNIQTRWAKLKAEAEFAGAGNIPTYQGLATLSIEMEVLLDLTEQTVELYASQL